ncbi:MAG: type I restriction endonuclease [Cyanobacteria bacterium P01_G01_bin.39]
MDFIDQIKTIAQRIDKVKDKVINEEATKTAFIIPFIEALGYDIYNPGEVFPEYTADIPVLKNDKVDYAILSEGKPTILIECKCCQDSLDNFKHTAQLHRYFQNTEARFGVLTNGITYRFYTDIDTGHIMDTKPFFEFNLTKFNDSDVNELKKFSKANFDPNTLNDTAQNLLYTKEIKRLVTEQFANPSAELVKFFACQIYNKRMTSNAVEKFTEITKASLKEFINERIAERLKSAMEDSEKIVEDTKETTEEIEKQPLGIENAIVTTEEELEGFYIVKSVLREVLDVSKLQSKDTINYFGINLYGKVNQTVCRLYFNGKRKYISIIDANGKEVKKEIANLDGIYGVAEFLKDRITYLTEGKYISEARKVEAE